MEERGVLEDSTVTFRLWGSSAVVVVVVTTPPRAGVCAQGLKTESLGNRDTWELRERPRAPAVASHRARLE